MPQQLLDLKASTFYLISPFLALSILRVYTTGQTQEQVQEVTNQITATLQVWEQKFQAQEQQLQAVNKRA